MGVRLAGCLGVVALLAGTALAGEAGPKVSPEKARENFEVSYKAGVAATAEKDWKTAEVLFEAALKALGSTSHPNKIAAEALLRKAKKINQSAAPATPAKATEPAKAPDPVKPPETPAKKPDTVKPTEPAKTPSTVGTKPAEKPKYASYDAALMAGLDALDARKWKGATEAFDAALGFKPGDKAASVGLKRAQKGLGSVPATTTTKPKTVSTTTETKPVTKPAATLPRPIALVRSEWSKGAGSDGIWAGRQYHLEGGDMKFRRSLKFNFQAIVALEARMDHRSSIYIELRPKNRKYPKVRGYGSKEGSGPYLSVNKKVVGRGGAQPSSRQITLGFIRTGKQITFYCNGKRVAETWDIPAEEEVYWWVCNKGTMNAAAVSGGK